MKDKKILGGGALLVCAALFWFVLKPQMLDAAPPPVYTEEEIAAAARPTLTLPESVLNLLAPPTAPAYVKVQLAIEFADPEHTYVGLSPQGVARKNEELALELEPDMHRIKDVVNGVIGGATVEAVSTPEGREELKAGLIAALNDHMHESHVENVFFLTFITQ